jgi:hypothetical protein
MFATMGLSGLNALGTFFENAWQKLCACSEARVLAQVRDPIGQALAGSILLKV